jgi:uncharacterized protein (DUF608 family)
MMAKELTNKALEGENCCDDTDCCQIDRRMFVKLGGATLAALGTNAGLSAAAGPFSAEDTIDHFIPVDKKLQPAWVKSLFEPGTPTWYAGDELSTIGMPVGGVCAGQVYLTGDGRLVYWGIFNQQVNSGYGAVNYKVGREPTEMVVGQRNFVSAPDVDQGFSIKVTSNEGTDVRSLDRKGFPEVRFCGEYPIGKVDYVDDTFPVHVKLEAYSPFIPLNEKDSALPATVLNYTLKNTSDQPVEATIAGRLQNCALHYSQDRCEASYRRISQVKTQPGITSVLLGTRKIEGAEAPTRKPIVLADFEGGDYGDWQIEGEAFGKAPAGGTLERQQRVSGFRGKGLVNTYLGGSDQLQGKAVSPKFTINRAYVSFLVGGGDSKNTAIRLIVDGQVVRSASGTRNERLAAINWNVRALEGKTAHLEIVDAESGAWGHVNVDQIELRDTPMVDAVTDARQLPDFGTLAISVVGEETALVSKSLPPSAGAVQIFDGDRLLEDNQQERRLSEELRGAVGQQVRLQPGEEVTITFVVSWCMPNLYRGDNLVRNRYAKRFRNAVEVAQFVAANLPRLQDQTRLWRDTYYDSTLPRWLLDRLHSTLANLATETCQWWENGRFWAFEGCGCCHGTCGHVWNYEHAMARLFPALERSVREMQDFAPGVGLIPETGEIRFRGENWGIWAGDSQGGYILKAYREHQLCPDDAFLKRNWPNIRKAVQFLIDQDGNADGLIEGRQHQTYDQDYYGANTMVGSLYLGALRAAEEMARELGDEEFAGRCRAIFEKGSQESVDSLFNGEYFIQDVDLEKHPDWQYADGCLADQMFGQGWAHQVGLGYLYPVDTVRKSLASIWKYCWAPDVGRQNESHEPARWFAYPGEAGLFTCTWPKSKHLGPKSTRYRNEIWTGIEYQVANHMAYEGMLTEALAICRAVHDRYHPSKHNPFNEIECGDHYARALASWGVLLGLAGFEYHGPKRHLGFLPRLAPDRFRVVYTTADSWGTYQQEQKSGRQLCTIDVKWGELAVRSLAFGIPKGKSAKSARVQGPAGELSVSLEERDGRVQLHFADEITVPADQRLAVSIEC